MTATVTAPPICSPSYLLNGLSNRNYWYQVGIAWNVAQASGSGYTPGFSFVFEVWNPQKQSIYPTGGGSGVLSFGSNVKSGDIVQLGLSFEGENVAMSAVDLATNARENASYGASGANFFIGVLQPQFAFTGLMTEWHQATPYFTSSAKITYSNAYGSLSLGRMCIEEWNFTGIAFTNVSSGSNTPMFGGCSQNIIDFTTSPDTLKSFSVKGITIYADVHKFITS